jgi:hypothetical protein
VGGRVWGSVCGWGGEAREMVEWRAGAACDERVRGGARGERACVGGGGGGVREGRWGAGEVGRGMVGPGRPALFRCCAWIFVKDV